MFSCRDERFRENSNAIDRVHQAEEGGEICKYTYGRFSEGVGDPMGLLLTTDNGVPGPNLTPSCSVANKKRSTKKKKKGADVSNTRNSKKRNVSSENGSGKNER